ncbi:hypothetical protein CRM22_000380 [Opisthorchis felineus]|uniref:Dynein light chain n=1 Tax=Opisthorchis felineus TaxID=147828 RepID=A0A4S2MF92_OPIFE|nr:hypothetical protein CRM22_000380 [Opisthorchis felineus]
MSQHSHSSSSSDEDTKETKTENKAVIKKTDMNLEMQQAAVDATYAAMEAYEKEKDVAANVKREFDKKYSPTWNCFVGKDFGCYLTHQKGTFIYFLLMGKAVLLFKAGEYAADD